MSLLTDTQGTPDRVFSLLRVLHAVGGEFTLDEAKAWLDPQYRGRDPNLESQETAVRQTLGSAASLGFIESNRGRYRLLVAPPASAEAFADLVHATLCRQEPDSPDGVVLGAYAAVVVLSERNGGTLWTSQARSDFAAQIDLALRGEEDADRRFNREKYAAWFRWMSFLGLGTEVPGNNAASAFYPSPASRLDRELGQAQLPGELPAEEFLAVISRRMPYLDGGNLFREIAARLGVTLPARTLSLILSAALRDLHDDGRLTLDTPGDAASAWSLARDPSHAVGTVKTVHVVREVAGHA